MSVSINRSDCKGLEEKDKRAVGIECLFEKVGRPIRPLIGDLELGHNYILCVCF